jgi:hypothetical protein
MKKPKPKPKSQARGAGQRQGMTGIPKLYSVRILWDEPEPEKVAELSIEYVCKTNAELAAFMQGVEAACPFGYEWRELTERQFLYIQSRGDKLTGKQFEFATDPGDHEFTAKGFKLWLVEKRLDRKKAS